MAPLTTLVRSRGSRLALGIYFRGVENTVGMKCGLIAIGIISHGIIRRPKL